MSTATDPPIHVPKPRRPFELDMTASSSTTNSGNSTPRRDLPAWLDQTDPTSPTRTDGTTASTSTVASPTATDFSKRTKSVLNLTTSTLFGIYSSVGGAEGTEPPTPSMLSRTNSMVNVRDTMPRDLAAINNSSVNGRFEAPTTNGKTGAKTKTRRRGPRTSVFSMVVRMLALLGFGIGYGVIVMHLHNTRTFTPAWWEDVEGYNAAYLLVWGLVGVVLGSALPWIDILTGESGETDGKRAGGNSGATEEGNTDWIQVVRSVGAFIGIAYGIRKLPWQSTTQISLTLALVNPFLWYIVDRTRAGFALASAVGVAGTLVLIQLNPNYIQAPTHMAFQSAHPSTSPYPSSSSSSSADGTQQSGTLMNVSYETLSVGAWLASVLFCSCVCFGNIGRKLALRERDL